MKLGPGIKLNKNKRNLTKLKETASDIIIVIINTVLNYLTNVAECDTVNCISDIAFQ